MTEDTDRRLPRLPRAGSSKAVLVGVTRYTHDGWPATDLPEARENVKALKEMLVRGGGFHPDDVEELLDPDTEAVIQAVEAAVPAPDPKNPVAGLDTLLFYFVGHGLVRDSSLHLALGGASPSSARSLVDVRTLCRDIKPGMPHRVLFVLDCCHAGAARATVSRLNADTSTSTATALLAAVQQDGQAMLRGANGRTPFTGVLLDVLDRGAAPGPDLLTLHWLEERVLAGLTAAGAIGNDLQQPVWEAYGPPWMSMLALGPNPALQTSGLVVEVRAGAVVSAAACSPSRRPQRIEGPLGGLDDVVAAHAATLRRLVVVHESHLDGPAVAGLVDLARAASGAPGLTVDALPRAVVLAAVAVAPPQAGPAVGRPLAVVEEVGDAASATLVTVGAGRHVESTGPRSLAGLGVREAAQRREDVVRMIRALRGVSLLHRLTGVPTLLAPDRAVDWPVRGARVVGRVVPDPQTVLAGAWEVATAAPVRRASPSRARTSVPWPVGALGAALGVGGFGVLHTGLGVTTGVAASVGAAAAVAAAVAGRVRSPRS